MNFNDFSLKLRYLRIYVGFYMQTFIVQHLYLRRFLHANFHCAAFVEMRYLRRFLHANFHCAAFVEMSSGNLCEDEKAPIRARQNFTYSIKLRAAKI